jgi:flagellar assembly protein FliH
MLVDSENTRVIDTNAKAEEKLKEIAIELAKKCGEEPDFADGFTQGITAVDVSQLVGDEFEGIENSGDGQETDGNGNPVLYKKTIQVAASSEQIKEDLISEAKAEIENMKQEAQTHIDQERVKAVEEGKSQGYQEGLEEGKAEGYKQGHQEGLDSVAQLKEELLKENEEAKDKLEKEYQQKLREVEPKFIDTLTGIYEHIFHVNLKNSRELIVYLIQNTMRNIEGGGTYLIHVSKEDFPFASMQKKELVKGTNINLDNVELLEDATLTKNECMIETGNGVFDCSLGTQLEALNEQLRLLSYEP